jgi:hypothetical protein
MQIHAQTIQRIIATTHQIDQLHFQIINHTTITCNQANINQTMSISIKRTNVDINTHNKHNGRELNIIVTITDSTTLEMIIDVIYITNDISQRIQFLKTVTHHKIKFITQIQANVKR